MKKLSCIVTDLDGTLLDRNNLIGDADLATIRTLKSKGIPTFIVTGRHVRFSKQIHSQLGFEPPLCGCNGGHIYDFKTEQTLYARHIEPGIARRVYDFLNKRGLPYILYTETRTVFSGKDSGRYSFWKRENERFAPENRSILYLATDPDFDFDRERLLKFLLGPLDTKPLEKEINRLFNHAGELSVVSSGNGLLDINAVDVNKGTGVAALSRMYGFSVDETMALGDNYNDLPMLQIAGYPVAPETAEAAAKEQSCFVTSRPDDAPLTHAVKALFPALLDG